MQNYQQLMTPVVAILALMSSAAVAQVNDSASSYPSKPVRAIIANVPGGSIDFVTRIIAAELTKSLGQRFVTENIGGASGITAAQTVARAAPDGYTLLFTGSSYGVNPGLRPDLPFDPIKDIAPITNLSKSGGNLLVITPSLPIKSVKELIAYAKSKPGELSFSSSGNGGSPHLGGELFKMMTGTNMIHVPYKGAAPALTDVIAGRVQLNFASIPSALGHVRAGKLRALAVTSLKRSSTMPDVPTLSESGLPGFEMAGWQGMFTTGGAPKPVIDKLNREVATIMCSPEIIKSLAEEGGEPVANSPEEFDQWLRAEIAKWTKVIRTVGIKVD